MASTVKTTTLEVGTLSIPVALRTVSEKKEPGFVRGTSNGDAVKRQEVAATAAVEAADTGVPARALEAGEIKRGVMEDGVFFPIPDEEIAKIEAATKLETFEILSFVPLEDVPFERAKDCYYLTPQRGQSPRALRLLLDAMKPVVGPRGKVVRTARAGVFKLMPRSRQHLAIVYPVGDGLFVSTLHWAEDFVQAGEAVRSLEGVATDERHLEAARALVDTLTDPALEVLDAQVDDMRALKLELMEKAAAGKFAVGAPAPAGKSKAKAAAPDSATDALMASLEASIAAAKKTTRAAR